MCGDAGPHFASTRPVSIRRALCHRAVLQPGALFILAMLSPPGMKTRPQLQPQSGFQLQFVEFSFGDVREAKFPPLSFDIRSLIMVSARA